MSVTNCIPLRHAHRVNGQHFYELVIHTCNKNGGHLVHETCKHCIRMIMITWYDYEHITHSIRHTRELNHPREKEYSKSQTRSQRRLISQSISQPYRLQMFIHSRVVHTCSLAPVNHRVLSRSRSERWQKHITASVSPHYLNTVAYMQSVSQPTTLWHIHAQARQWHDVGVT